MNLLPLKSGTLVNRLPLFTSRTNTIKYLLFANVGLYGLYLFGNGSVQLKLA